jgi:peroxiredoxin
MNNQKKLKKISLSLTGIAAITVLIAFVTFGGWFPQSQTAPDKNHELLAKSHGQWDVAFTSSFGKEAPDLTIEDVGGKTHKLSDYRGRNVMVVFWATWCPACNLEIPHLIELRKTIAKDKLAILAISNEEPERLKSFVESKGINYTVASLGGKTLQEPFANVSAIPTTFFIDPDGKIKFAAMGVVSPADAKTIMNMDR